MQHLNKTNVLTLKAWREVYNKGLQTLMAEKSPKNGKASIC